MKSLGLGVVGCGGAAVDVVRAVAAVPGLSVVAVHDRQRLLADDLAALTKARVHDSLTSFLSDGNVEAAYVAVPHDLLASIARTALLSGLHVLVEKPMAITVDDIDELDTLAKAKNRTLAVMYEMRFAPASLAARSYIRRGAIGRVTGVRIRTLIDKPRNYWRVGLTGRSSSSWRGQVARAGGGVVLMNTSHQLDLVSAITQLRVVSVSAITGTFSPGIDVEDTASAIFHFSNGAIGSLTAAAHVPGANDGETLEIDGSLGQLTLDPYSGRLALFLRRPWGDLEAGRWLDLAMETSDPFVPALRSFLTAARTSAPPTVGAREARTVLATVRAIYLSAAEQRVVKPA